MTYPMLTHSFAWWDLFAHKESVQLLITKGTDMNAKNDDSSTSLDFSILLDNKETADLLRKHGGKTGEELKAEGKWCLSKNPVKLR